MNCLHLDNDVFSSLFFLVSEIPYCKDKAGNGFLVYQDN
jgi:hypothetical protein